jgi:hypothetical protein
MVNRLYLIPTIILLVVALVMSGNAFAQSCTPTANVYINQFSVSNPTPTLSPNQEFYEVANVTFSPAPNSTSTLCVSLFNGVTYYNESVSINPGQTWVLINATGYAPSNYGLYTGSLEVESAVSSESDSISINVVQPGTLTSLVVSPTTITTTAGSTYSISATAYFTETNETITLEFMNSINGVTYTYNVTVPSGYTEYTYTISSPAPSSVGNYSGTVVVDAYPSDTSEQASYTLVVQSPSSTSTPTFNITGASISPNPVYTTPNSTFSITITAYYTSAPSGIVLTFNVTFNGKTYTNSISVPQGSTEGSTSFTLTAPTSPGTYSGEVVISGNGSSYSTSFTVIVNSSITPTPVPSPFKLINVTVTPSTIYATPTEYIPITVIAYYANASSKTPLYFFLKLDGITYYISGIAPPGTGSYEVVFQVLAPGSPGHFVGSVKVIGANQVVTGNFTLIVNSTTTPSPSAFMITSVHVIPRVIFTITGESVMLNVNVTFTPAPNNTVINLVINVGNKTTTTSIPVNPGSTNASTTVSLTTPLSPGLYIGTVTASAWDSNASTWFFLADFPPYAEITSLTVTPNPVMTSVGSQFTITVNLGVTPMPVPINVTINVDFNGFIDFQPVTIPPNTASYSVKFTLTAPTSTGTYVGTVTAFGSNNESTSFSVIVTPTPPPSANVTSVSVTPNPVSVGYGKQFSITVNAGFTTPTSPVNASFMVVFNNQVESRSVTLGSGVNTSSVSFTLTAPSKIGNYTGEVIVSTPTSSVSESFRVIVTGPNLTFIGMKIIPSTQYTTAGLETGVWVIVYYNEVNQYVPFQLTFYFNGQEYTSNETAPAGTTSYPDYISFFAPNQLGTYTGWVYVSGPVNSINETFTVIVNNTVSMTTQINNVSIASPTSVSPGASFTINITANYNSEPYSVPVTFFVSYGTQFIEKTIMAPPYTTSFTYSFSITAPSTDPPLYVIAGAYTPNSVKLEVITVCVGSCPVISTPLLIALVVIGIAVIAYLMIRRRRTVVIRI